jgi:NodT family efflux transporter outer membrane factor (OMF) lipoprotein
LLGGQQVFDPAADIPGEWWTVFQSPALNQLITQALAANPTLAAAQASLRVARENLLAQEGSFYPQIDLALNASKNQTSTASLSPASASGKPFYSLYTGQLNISYTPDLFGLNRRTAESLAAEAENQQYELEAAYLTLTSNVVGVAVQEASTRAQIKLWQHTVQTATTLEGIVQKQYAVGEVSQQVLVQQQTAIAQAQAMLPPLTSQLAIQKNAMRALTGAFPTEALSPDFDLTALQLPRTLPVSLPSKLVAQRPDILAASAAMHAASARVGVAIANRLPQFPLTAQFGTSPNAIENAFTPYNQFFSVVAGLTQPIFEGGTLLHRQRAAQAQFDVAAAQYRQTVLSAFQNVADVLRALQSDADELQAAETAERAAVTSLGIAQEELQVGEISNLAVLNALQSYQSVQLALVQAQTARLNDTAALFEALGGGWWNRSDIPPSRR